VVNSTIAFNEADTSHDGGGIYAETGASTVTLQNSIISDNINPNSDDLYGDYNSGGHNIVLTTNGYTFIGGVNDLLGTDPLLNPVLANNGGPSSTHALTLASPAIDYISAPYQVVTVDQRNYLRDALHDVGAFEYLAQYD